MKLSFFYVVETFFINVDYKLFLIQTIGFSIYINDDNGKNSRRIYQMMSILLVYCGLSSAIEYVPAWYFQTFAKFSLSSYFTGKGSSMIEGTSQVKVSPWLRLLHGKGSSWLRLLPR